MSKSAQRKLRKAVEATLRGAHVAAWRAMCAAPLRKRAGLALRLLMGHANRFGGPA